MLTLDDGIFLAILAPFLAAAIAPLVHRLFGSRTAWVLAIIPAWMFVHFAGLIERVSFFEAYALSVEWIPAYGIEFSFFIDGLGLLFALLISGIGTLIILYSGGYLKGHPDQGRFYSFIFLFMGSMMGVVLADNLITLFIYWELTSITSFLLIGFDHKRLRARRAAIQALVITGAGGLALLAGFVLMMLASDSTSFSEIASQPDIIRNSPYYLPILILVLAGAFTKSAQFPFHVWLPNAMEAPTPVSAYLHSATMVKAGVYLLMRVQPILGGTQAWMTILPLFGGTTLIIGTFLAIRQKDLKLMLAYTTVASLGLLVMLIGTSLEIAITGAVFYLFAHSLFKGSLFMVAGCIDHGAGTRDVTKLGGLKTFLPVTFVAAIFAALSMGGLPPFIGFLAKEEIYLGILDTSISSWIITGVAIIGNGLMLTIGLVVALKPFLGPKIKTPVSPHEAPLLMLAGPVILSTLGLLCAIFGEWVSGNLIGPAVSSITGHSIELQIQLGLHFNMPLLLSAITVAFGVLIYLNVDKARAAMVQCLDIINISPDRGFDHLMNGLVKFASKFTRIIQGGRLDVYLTVTFILTATAMLYPMWQANEWPAMPGMPDLYFYEWAIMAIAVIGLFAMIIAHNRLTAIVSMGIQGFAVAVLYILLGAPDLSFTQFMVETLSVVILALVMTRLSLKERDARTSGRMVFDVIVAVSCGLAFGLTLLAVTQGTFDPALSVFFSENSRVIAHGRNVVNVIIVDFRGTDTLGEIGVVTITGLAILALIRFKSSKTASGD